MVGRRRKKPRVWFDKGYRSFARIIKGQLVIWSEEYNAWIDPEEHPGIGDSIGWKPRIRWRDPALSKKAYRRVAGFALTSRRYLGRELPDYSLGGKL